MGLLQVNNREFNLIKKLVYDKAGIHLRDSKMALVSNRLRKRLVKFGFNNYKKYYDFIMGNPEGEKELTVFLDALTTNETYFFRNSKHFIFFANIIRRLRHVGAGKIQKIQPEYLL